VLVPGAGAKSQGIGDNRTAGGHPRLIAQSAVIRLRYLSTRLAAEVMQIGPVVDESDGAAFSTRAEQGALGTAQGPSTLFRSNITG